MSRQCLAVLATALFILPASIAHAQDRASLPFLIEVVFPLF